MQQIQGYSDLYREVHGQQNSVLRDGREEELFDSIARGRQMSAATNRRRRALAFKKKIEQQREEKRRQEILARRRAKQREVTEKFQRRNSSFSSSTKLSSNGKVTVEDALLAIRQGSPTPSGSSTNISNFSNSCYNNFGPSSRSEAQVVSTTYNNKYTFLRNMTDSSIKVNNTETKKRNNDMTPSSMNRYVTDLYNRGQNNLICSRNLFEQQLQEQQQLLIDQQRKSLYHFNEALMKEMLNDKKIQGENLLENEENDSVISKDSLEDEKLLSDNVINTGCILEVGLEGEPNNKFPADSKFNDFSNGKNDDRVLNTWVIPTIDDLHLSDNVPVAKAVSDRVQQILNGDDDLQKLRVEYMNSKNNIHKTDIVEACYESNAKLKDKNDASSSPKKSLKGILKSTESSQTEEVLVKGIGCHVLKKDNIRDSIDINRKILEAKEQKHKQRKKSKKKSVRFIDLVYDEDDEYDEIDKNCEKLEDDETDHIPKENGQSSNAATTTSKAGVVFNVSKNSALADHDTDLSSKQGQSLNNVSIHNVHVVKKESLIPTPPRNLPQRPTRPVSARVVSSALKKPPRAKPRISSAPVTRRTPTRQYNEMTSKPPIAVRNAFIDINVDGAVTTSCKRQVKHNGTGFEKGQIDHYAQTYSDQIKNGSGDHTEADIVDTCVNLNKTPTDAEINWLWNKVRTCLNRESHTSSLSSARPEPRHANNQATFIRGRSFSANSAMKNDCSKSPSVTTTPATNFVRDDSNIVTKNGISESMAAFLTAETLSNQSMVELDINKAMDQAQKKQFIYNRLKHQNPSKEPTNLSVEEEQLMMSLDRLNERLRITGNSTQPNNPSPPQQVNSGRPQSGFRGHIPLNSHHLRRRNDDTYANSRPGINRPTYNRPHLHGW